MASIIDYKKCDRCGGEVYYEFNYHTDEEFSVCRSCGAHHAVILIWTETDDAVTDKTGHWQYTREQSPGFGCLYVQYTNGAGELSCLDPNLTEKQIQELLSIFTEENVNPEKSYLYIWNEDSERIDVLFGPQPVFYEEIDETDQVEKGGNS